MQLHELQMNSSSSSFGSSKQSHYTRGFDLPDGSVADRRHNYSHVGGAMLPIFLNDLHRHNADDDEFVEVTLELDHDSIVVRGVSPTRTARGDQRRLSSSPANEPGIFGRSLSATSKICRKFGWLRSGSCRMTSSEFDMVIASREERRVQAKLQRATSGAQRALKGLRFINRTTGTATRDVEEMWETVEAKFQKLARDGLLAREDFGECIGEGHVVINLCTLDRRWPGN